MIGQIFRKIRTKFFTALCKRKAAKTGKGLYVNHWCKFSPKTIIGNHCHFNGMKCIIISSKQKKNLCKTGFPAEELCRF